MNSVPEEDKLGTVYSNWVLARSSSHNHNVAHFRRIRAKDRYNIHKLTNIQFMIWLGTHQHQYFLTLNEKIMLLAQINHVCNVLKRDKAQYNSFIRTIISDILRCSVSPDDLIW